MSTPKLRFKEFSREWENKKYQDVLNIKYGKDHKNLNSGDIPVYGTGGIMRHVNKYLYDGESILIGRKGTIDQPKYVNEKFWTVDTLFYSEIHIDKVFPKFLYQHALQVNWLSLNEATGVPSLNTTSINNVSLSIPTLTEQTKIATFLTAVDEKINQLSQKQELLTQYKKGMMQKLFSQQIRFKADDGSEFGAWVERTIKDIADVKGGKRLPKGYSLVAQNTGHPYITVSDMNRSYGIDHENIKYVPIEAVDAINRYTITDKDIFISVAGTLGIIGKISSEFNGANLTENADKLTNLKCNQIFLIYLLDSGYLSSLIESTATTSAQPKLALYTIQDLKILMPLLSEQTKIANFLSAIDQKIDLTTQQLEQAKQWKKGLLQHMFV
ncbi:restriction endonuclease subunit S [Acinetobacter boissieri]|uniref:Type I restriction enzyme, S subunit n=1 Tax=Acinetobacter boissieri TaxID=1219383 RepID=A0A1G6IUV1_9GAMM|nr:restriction endonuclease subunit S [Acinetobacter boissieri]SDC10287.1 type I restriction enzyme, S subunit [Acinetobacter boissieri]